MAFGINALLALLLIAIVYPCCAQDVSTSTSPPVDAAVAVVDNSDVVWYNVSRRLVVNCTIPNPENAAIQWSINGTAVASIEALKGRYETNSKNQFVITHSLEDDFGNYTCQINDEKKTVRVHGRPHLRLPPNTNVVEGQKLKLTCRVTGKPRPVIDWEFTNEDKVFNNTPVEDVFGNRVTLAKGEQEIVGGELIINETLKSDAGYFKCIARDTLSSSTTTVRVKDVYAALWPFLGICAEVLVLCAIILLYERRRTKPDMEDSDADNHDQKKS